jgi:hypothetical protein
MAQRRREKSAFPSIASHQVGGKHQICGTSFETGRHVSA